MAAAVTLGVQTGSTSNTNSYASGSFTPAAGDLLVAFVSASATTAASPTLTDSDGVPFTLLTDPRPVRASSADTTYVFVATERAAATLRTVTFDCSGDNATGCLITVVRISGTSRSGLAAIVSKGSQSNQTSGTTPAPVLDATPSTDSIVMVSIFNNSGTLTEPTTNPGTWTNLASAITSTTPSIGQRITYHIGGVTSATLTFGGVSGGGQFAAAALEIYGLLDSQTAGPVSADATADVVVAGATIDAGAIMAGPLVVAGTADAAIAGALRSTTGGPLLVSATTAATIAGALRTALPGALSAGATAAAVVAGATRSAYAGPVALAAAADGSVALTTRTTFGGALVLPATAQATIDAALRTAVSGPLALSATGAIVVLGATIGGGTTEHFAGPLVLSAAALDLVAGATRKTFAGPLVLSATALDLVAGATRETYAGPLVVPATAQAAVAGAAREVFAGHLTAAASGLVVVAAPLHVAVAGPLVVNAAALVTLSAATRATYAEALSLLAAGEITIADAIASVPGFEHLLAYPAEARWNISTDGGWAIGPVTTRWEVST